MWSSAQEVLSLAGETNMFKITTAQMKENNSASQRIMGVAGKTKRRCNTSVGY